MLNIVDATRNERPRIYIFDDAVRRLQFETVSESPSESSDFFIFNTSVATSANNFSDDWTIDGNKIIIAVKNNTGIQFIFKINRVAIDIIATAKNQIAYLNRFNGNNGNNIINAVIGRRKIPMEVPMRLSAGEYIITITKHQITHLNRDLRIEPDCSMYLGFDNTIIMFTRT